MECSDFHTFSFSAYTVHIYIYIFFFFLPQISKLVTWRNKDKERKKEKKKKGGGERRTEKKGEAGKKEMRPLVSCTCPFGWFICLYIYILGAAKIYVVLPEKINT